MSASTSSAGAVRVSGHVLSGFEFAYPARPVLERKVAVADQVLITHHRPRALGQREVPVDGELDGHGAVLVQGHVTDLADLDAAIRTKLPPLSPDTFEKTA